MIRDDHGQGMSVDIFTKYCLHSCRIDNAAWTAAKAGFGNDKKHLLCRWHVDRFTMCTYCMQSAFLCFVLFASRNFRKNLYAKVKNKLYQVALYQGLCFILSETGRTKFHGYMNSFIYTWL